MNEKELEDILLWSMNEDQTLNIEKFKTACEENVLSINKSTPIAKLTKEEMLIRKFEEMTLKELLQDLSSTKSVSIYELNMFEKIKTKYKMTTPMMNVLVHYVVLEYKAFSKPLLDNIAKHWSRTDMTTAREAMDFAIDQAKHKAAFEAATPPVKSMNSSSNSVPPGETPFNEFDMNYIEKLNKKYNMTFDVAKEIVLYGRKVNQGLMIYWFLDGVAEFISCHDSKTSEETTDLLHQFHQKFVLNFGKE